ncbi:flagellar biosynthetic protein FliO [Rubrivirga sp. IMCC43871]|uniref:flagellar biosynthetic protein FliO n=1 Tax=Rubrivirga sp. IMCC43871 TaxID=3391575 RepID=UPI00398FAC2E
MTVPSDLRARLAALPLDRAPLRRAAVLAVLLVALLVAGKMVGPSRPAPPARQDVQGAAEAVSAPRSDPAAWTSGRVLAVVLLVGGGLGALVLRRRRPATAAARRLDVLESRPLGSTPALQLVACADEVLLVSVAADGARVLRHWPRDRFDGATALAELDPLAATATQTPAPVVLTVPPRPVVVPPAEPAAYPTFARALADAADLAGPPLSVASDAPVTSSPAPAPSPLPGEQAEADVASAPNLSVASAAPVAPPASAAPVAAVADLPRAAAPVASASLPWTVAPTGLPQFGGAHA